MTAVELALAFAAAMLAAGACGWGLRALRGSLGADAPDAAQADALAARLAEAEDLLDQEREAARAALAEAEARLAETQARLGGALAERQAELDATMDIVGSLRQRVEALRRGDDAA
ncbi:MAG: hypothetical protein AAF763_16810 [Pseudomonadota bacterium]